jgi:hypothetical protein
MFLLLQQGVSFLFQFAIFFLIDFAFNRLFLQVQLILRVVPIYGLFIHLLARFRARDEDQEYIIGSKT